MVGATAAEEAGTDAARRMQRNQGLSEYPASAAIFTVMR
jgi:hypothetical protein